MHLAGVVCLWAVFGGALGRVAVGLSSTGFQQADGTPVGAQWLDMLRAAHSDAGVALCGLDACEFTATSSSSPPPPVTLPPAASLVSMCFLNDTRSIAYITLEAGRFFFHSPWRTAPQLLPEAAYAEGLLLCTTYSGALSVHTLMRYPSTDVITELSLSPYDNIVPWGAMDLPADGITLDFSTDEHSLVRTWTLEQLFAYWPTAPDIALAGNAFFGPALYNTEGLLNKQPAPLGTGLLFWNNLSASPTLQATSQQQPQPGYFYGNVDLNTVALMPIVILTMTSTLDIALSSGFRAPSLQTVVLSGGKLALDVSRLTIADGTTLVLFSYASVSGSFSEIELIGTTYSCERVRATPKYGATETSVTFTIETGLCGGGALHSVF